nr:MAG: internal scaffolding protein [Microvirus sp.]
MKPETKPEFKTITQTKLFGKTRIRVQTFNNEVSMTDQSQEQESNVNYIMEKYSRTGVPPEFRSNGFYADLTNVPDLSTALQTVRQAQAAFDSLPSNIRQRFGNSPEFMTEFLTNPANKEEAISLGLINAPEPPPEPIMVKVVPEPISDKK